MERITFQARLVESTNVAVECARSYVFNILPPAYKYLLFPNQSYDENPLEMDEQTFPQESLPQNQHLGPLTAEEVVNYLWREGKVPEWIDINVHSSDKSYTYLRLLCCGRYTAADQLLYHQQEGSPPFHKGSPYIPPGWESVEKNGKFDVEWMQSANKRRPNNGMQRTRNIAALLKSIFRARR